MPTENPASTDTIVAAAMHGSIVVYAVVPFVVPLATSADAPDVLVPVLGAVAAIVIAAAALLPRFVAPAHTDERRRTLFLVRAALAESAAILGLVGAFLTGSPLIVAPFAVAALITQVAVGPFGRR